MVSLFESRVGVSRDSKQREEGRKESFSRFQSMGKATTPGMSPATTASNSEQLSRSPTDCALSASPGTSAELRLYFCVVVCVCAPS